MFAVGRIGSYISRGVYTVSGPFHPFGGAVDIVVVEQPDGTFKSSPWYVRFGKFQGVLKSSEKVVSINVNGLDADFNMHLDHKGEAFFLREVDAGEGELEPYVSSGDEMDVKADRWRHQKSKSCNFDASGSDLVSELGSSNGKNLTLNNCRRGRIFGLAFGRQSMKESRFQGVEEGPEVARASSMERAEMAADLLEVRWTTNLRVGSAQLSPSKSSATEGANKVIVEDGLNKNTSFVTGNGKHEFYQSVSDEHVDKIDVDLPRLANPGNIEETSTLEETYSRVGPSAAVSPISNRTDYGNITDGKSSQGESFSASQCSLKLAPPAEDQGAGSASYGQEHISSGGITQGESGKDVKVGIDKLESVNTSNNGCKTELCNTDEAILASELDKSVSKASGGQVEGVNLCSDVEELSSSIGSNLVRSSVVEPSDCMKGSINEVGSEYNSADSSDPSDDKCSGDSVSESHNNLEEEQWSFSDLDDPRVDNYESMGVPSLGTGECQSRGSPDSSEDELTAKDALDDQSHPLTGELISGDPLIDDPSPRVNSKSVSSPISIPKLQKDTEDGAVTPVAESLPNMLCNGGDLGVPQLLGRSLDSNLEAIKLVDDVLAASEFNTAQQQVQRAPPHTDSSHFSEEIKKIVSDPAVEVSLCRHLLYEGMGYEAAGVVFDAAKLDLDKFSSLSPEIVKDEKLVVRIGGLYFPWDAALPIASAIGSEGGDQMLEPKGMIAVGQVDNRTADRGAQKTMNSRSGSWRMWPFSFKRSNSVQDKSLDSQNYSKTSVVKVENTGAVGPKVSKKKIRANAPTSEQLASLNLKDGKNEVIFTFSTAMLGKQQVDARIFLWKWNTRIVISDVDGTITKSDVLGQFMPLMGIDWSQTGVTHLFSAIKENGYQLLFLSARSISQAYQTRQFLSNLKQDGKELPEGPIIISPDGLFPSLYREVIRRAPHEFKISCLEDIKVLFPPDHSPFYAGFGNRDTDELSYLKVGIPMGKIFIINPKGQIAVHRRVDTKSYSNLHDLVHRMFPTAPAPEKEDYNSWNFWRLPPPDILWI